MLFGFLGGRARDLPPARQDLRRCRTAHGACDPSRPALPSPQAVTLQGSGSTRQGARSARRPSSGCCLSSEGKLGAELAPPGVRRRRRAVRDILQALDGVLPQRKRRPRRAQGAAAGRRRRRGHQTRAEGACAVEECRAPNGARVKNGINARTVALTSTVSLPYVGMPCPRRRASSDASPAARKRPGQMEPAVLARSGRGRWRQRRACVHMVVNAIWCSSTANRRRVSVPREAHAGGTVLTNPRRTDVASSTRPGRRLSPVVEEILYPASQKG